jgi:hypothetical protein
MDNNFGIIFMKVGVHAKERLDDIIKRKRLEISTTGCAFWGYGGNTCHPITMVQPFAKSLQEKKQELHLCMEAIDSHHFAEPARATQYSSDGYNWALINNNINVLGSRYALVINSLEEQEFDLDLSLIQVAVGNSQGKSGMDYIQGRVDKGCLRFITPQPMPLHNPTIKHISLVANICHPYAVLLK